MMLILMTMKMTRIFLSTAGGEISILFTCPEASLCSSIFTLMGGCLKIFSEFGPKFSSSLIILTWCFHHCAAKPGDP